MSDAGKNRKRRRSKGQWRADMIKAIDHPLRRRMLRLLIAGDKALSPVQISRELGLPLGIVSYHARILAELGAVKRAGSKQVRGAVQRFFRTTIEDDPPVETLLEETREVDEESESRKGKKRRTGK